MIERQFLNDSVLQLAEGYSVYVYNEDFINIIVDKFKQKYNAEVEVKDKRDYFIIKPMKVIRGNNKNIKEVQ